MGGSLTRADRLGSALPKGDRTRSAPPCPSPLPVDLRGTHRTRARQATQPRSPADPRKVRHARGWRKTMRRTERRTMSTSQSLEALRRANPRNKASFNEAVDAAAAAVRLRIATAESTGEPRERHLRPRRRLVGVTAGVALAAAVAVAVFLTVGSSGVTPGVENAAAAIKKAAILTAASAKQSGTATVQMTHDGRLWVHKTVRWNRDDIEITDQSPGGSSSGLPLLVVNGMMYGHDPDHEGWVQVGPVSSIDPGSGTTPTDVLAAVREDMGGATLRRITGAMRAGALTATNLPDGRRRRSSMAIGRRRSRC